MKKKVISLRGLSEILSEKEMKNVMGGSYASLCLGNWMCSSDEYCDWYYLSCYKKNNGPYPKVEACDGKSPGASCSTEYNGQTYKGICIIDQFNAGDLYCSDVKL